MKQGELKRLIKIEERIYQIITEEMGYECNPVEFDIVTPMKMLEIMAYRCPTNISNWKYGRDFERYRTIFDNYDPNLPYEVVLNDKPCRAYLMNTNTLAIQALVIAHVYGHVNFYTENKWFQRSRNDVMALLSEANRRFNRYERIYGKDEVEKIIDAGHALQFHSNPFDEETEDQKRRRIFDQEKKKNKVDNSEFRDIVKVKKRGEDIEAYNNKLWRELLKKTPVEPQSDILGYIIDNSKNLDDWERDILDILRTEGKYFWPSMRTKFMNEGWACLVGNSLIDTDHGLISIEEIVKNKQDVRVFDGNVYRKVTNYFRNNTKKRIKIITKHGFELHGGYDHKIFNDGEWAELSSLSIGDTIHISKGGNKWNSKYHKIEYSLPRPRETKRNIIKRHHTHIQTIQKVEDGEYILDRNNCIHRAKLALRDIEENREINPGITKMFKIRVPEFLNEDLATYLGLMIGDGNIGYTKWGKGKHKHLQCLTTGDIELRDMFYDLSMTLFNVEPSIRKDENRWRMVSYHGNLTDFLINYLGMKYGFCAGDKEIPEMILSSPKSVVAAFIRSYFDADAHCTKNGSIILITKSKKLARQVQDVLLKFGIYSTISYQKPDSMQRLIISGIDSKIYMEQIGFNLKRKMERLQKSHINRKFYRKKNYKTKIVKIEEDKGTTYDITVDNTHKYFANGFVNHNCFTHQKVMEQLFEEGLLTAEEHGQYNHSNSLVKAEHPLQMNPYLVGTTIWEDIHERWDKGRHGPEWDECNDSVKRENWDTGAREGDEKIRNVMRSYTDWFFIQEFLTLELVDKLNMYLYIREENSVLEQDIITGHTDEQIKDIITRSFANSGIPLIMVDNGNFNKQSILVLEHKWNGLNLDLQHAMNTMKHVYHLWGNPIILKTKALNDDEEEKDLVLTYPRLDVELVKKLYPHIDTKDLLIVVEKYS